jgi:hypothetical protein
MGIVKRRLLPVIIASGVSLATGICVSLLFVLAQDQGYLPQIARLWGRLFTLLVMIAVAAEIVRQIGRRGD